MKEQEIGLVGAVDVLLIAAQAQELDPQEETSLRALIQRHYQRTGSPRAVRLLGQQKLHNFVRIQPIRLQESVEGVWRAFGAVPHSVHVPTAGLLQAPDAATPHYA